MALCLLLALCCQTLAAGRTLVPGGYTVGIKLYAEGLMVTEVEPDAPAQRAGLRRGDVILTAGGKKTASAQALLDSIQSAEPIVVRVERGGHEAEFLVTPEKTASGYRLGILVRDHIAGIGTVTYYDPVSLQYGALGHGVSGLDGTQLLMLQSGYLVRASVAEVRTGTRGTPGELHGIFDVTDAVGTVEKIQPAAFSARSHSRSPERLSRRRRLRRSRPVRLKSCPMWTANRSSAFPSASTASTRTQKTAGICSSR